MSINSSLIEQIRDIREQVLKVAAESLNVNDENTYRRLSEVALKLTSLIPLDNGANVGASTEQLAPASHGAPVAVRERSETTYEAASQRSDITPISVVYGGRRYRAELDTTRISSGGRGKCVLYEGDWMTTSGAAGLITGGSANGWRFWQYRRANGSEGPIQEIRDRYLQSDEYDNVPW